ncbi:MAG: GAF domain-containing protein [Chloroflexi bacterium]|nr:GAF domain-containing protein [Chloroflexota bacterium]
MSPIFHSLRDQQSRNGQDEAARQAAQRAEALRTAFEFSQEIVGQLELDALLRSVTERARALMQADGAALCLLDDGQTTLALAAQSGLPNDNRPYRQPIALGLAPEVIGEGATVITETTCSGCRFLLDFAPGVCVAAPLQVGTETLGALCVAHSAADLHGDGQSLTLLANAAAMAIVNARMAERGRQQARQAALHAERERMAGELHDNLAQTLGFLNLKIDRVRELQAGAAWEQAAAELAQMQAAVGRAYAQVRQALTGLSGPLGDEEKDQEQLRACVEELRREVNAQVELSLDEQALAALAPLTRQQALHIVRESLANIRRHAQAERVRICVAWQGAQVALTVQDNGQGFDPAAVDSNQHLGLRIMQQRAARSGGVLEVASTPGQGTTVEARFPLDESDSGNRPDVVGHSRERLADSRNRSGEIRL